MQRKGAGIAFAVRRKIRARFGKRFTYLERGERQPRLQTCNNVVPNHIRGKVKPAPLKGLQRNTFVR